jgi:S-adenosyl-L-methionine hydrolase (adenosine-forming)
MVRIAGQSGQTISARSFTSIITVMPMTGLRAIMLPGNARLAAAGHVFERAGTFGDRPLGTAFWYENSNGLVDIAVNQARANRELGLAIGNPVEIVLE